MCLLQHVVVMVVLSGVRRSADVRPVAMHGCAGRALATIYMHAQCTLSIAAARPIHAHAMLHVEREVSLAIGLP